MLAKDDFGNLSMQGLGQKDQISGLEVDAQIQSLQLHIKTLQKLN